MIGEIRDIHEASWEKIRTESDQVAAYYEWCQKVVKETKGERLDLNEAAYLLVPLVDKGGYTQLDANADVQLIMSHCSDLTMDDDIRYVDDDTRRHDWQNICSIIERHASQE